MNIFQIILIKLIEAYQKYLSPDHSLWAKRSNALPYCKFTPTCSEYAKEAIMKKGALWGGIKAFWRVLRCNPWNRGGFDPVDKSMKGNL